MIEIQVRENLPLIKKGSYTRTRADCEFCGEKHTYKDDYCELTFDGVESNSTPEAAQSTTIG